MQSPNGNEEAPATGAATPKATRATSFREPSIPEESRRNKLTAVIPQAMRDRRQWVVFDITGKKKVPMIPGTKIPADASDPGTWRTFDAALADRFGRTLGYAFTLDDGITGIDVDDDAYDEDGNPLDYAQETLATFADTYAETSPSGTGVHIYVGGNIRNLTHNKSGNKVTGLGLEVYDQSRFFTVTGDKLPNSPTRIVKHQPALNAWFQKHIAPHITDSASEPILEGADPSDFLDPIAAVERAKHSASGPSFNQLWQGDTSDYPSDSEADFALANHLAFWIGPFPDKIEAAMRLSGLARDKWDKHPTYLRDTVHKALAGRTEFYKPPKPDPIPEFRPGDKPAAEKTPASRFSVLSFDETLDLPQADEIIEGIHPRRGLVMTVGASAAGKSTLVFEMAAAMASGRPFAGRHRVKEPVHVHIVVGEGLRGISNRLAALADKHDLDDDAKGRITFTPEMPQLFTGREAEVDAFANAIKAQGVSPDVFFVDTLRTAMRGANENSQQDTEIVLQGLRRLQRHFPDCVVNFLHHENKNGTYSGNTNLMGACDAILRVNRSGDLRTLESFKAKDGEPFDALPFEIVSQVIPGRTTSFGEEAAAPVVKWLTRDVYKEKTASGLTSTQRPLVHWLEDNPGWHKTSDVHNGVGRTTEIQATTGLLKDLANEDKIKSRKKGRYWEWATMPF